MIADLHELKKLRKLKECGLISADTFEKHKAALMKVSAKSGRRSLITLAYHGQHRQVFSEIKSVLGDIVSVLIGIILAIFTLLKKSNHDDESSFDSFYGNNYAHENCVSRIAKWMLLLISALSFLLMFFSNHQQ